MLGSGLQRCNLGLDGIGLLRQLGQRGLQLRCFRLSLLLQFLYVSLDP